MNLRTYTIEELQSHSIAGDEEALKELGRRMINMRIHDHYDEIFCTYKIELESLQNALDIELPVDCPHCGRWLTDV